MSTPFLPLGLKELPRGPRRAHATSSYAAVAGDADLPLSYAPSYHLAMALVQLGLLAWPEGAAPAHQVSEPWPVYLGSEPAEPANCVTIYDTTPITLARGKYSYGTQLRLRANDGATGRAKAEQLAHAVETQLRQMAMLPEGAPSCLVAARQLGVVAMGPGFPASKRNLYAVNVLLQLRRLP